MTDYETDDDIHALVFVLGMTFAGLLVAKYNPCSNPRNINPDYVNPRTIEFRVEDKDFNKMKETYIKVNGKDYLFKMVDGQPKVVPYNLRKTTEAFTSQIEKTVLEEK